MQRCLEQDLNPRPTDRKRKCLTVAPPRHLMYNWLTTGCTHPGGCRRPYALATYQDTATQATEEEDTQCIHRPSRTSLHRRRTEPVSEGCSTSSLTSGHARTPKCSPCATSTEYAGCTPFRSPSDPSPTYLLRKRSFSRREPSAPFP